MERTPAEDSGDGSRDGVCRVSHEETLKKPSPQSLSLKKGEGEEKRIAMSQSHI
jgi:hypothetical protein